MGKIILEALLRERGFLDYPMAAIGHIAIVALFGILGPMPIGIAKSI